MVNLPRDYKDKYASNMYFLFYNSLFNWSFSWKIKVSHPMVHLHGIIHLWKIERTEKQNKNFIAIDNNTSLLNNSFSTIYNIYYDSLKDAYFILREHDCENNQTKYKKIILTHYDDVLSYMWLYVNCRSKYLLNIKEKQMLLDGIGSPTNTSSNTSIKQNKFIVECIEEDD